MPRFLKTKFYAVDLDARLIRAIPYASEAASAVPGNRLAIRGDRLNRHPLYSTFVVADEQTWAAATQPHGTSGTATRHHARKKAPAQLQREIDEVLAGSSEAYAEAKAQGAALEAEVNAAGAVLNAPPFNLRGPLGLIPDEVRLSPSYRAAKARFDSAFARLRAFNGVFVKRFAKELRAERSARTRTRGTIVIDREADVIATRCTQVADEVVPEYRGGKHGYSCTGNMAKRWQAAWDAACIALGRDPDAYREVL